jgi:subtilisin family serine protease
MATTTPEDPELVVDLPQFGRIRDELNRRGVAYGPEESDIRLGLVRLPLTNLAPDVLPLRADSDLVSAAVITRAVSGVTGPLDDLDLLMFAVRKSFADRYAGWTPTIGKNRLIAGVVGAPHIDGGIPPVAEGDPKPIEDAEHLAALRAEFAVPPYSDEAAADVRVGILDTAIVEQHELTDHFADAGVMAQPAEPAPSMLGHATFVAGLIARRAPTAKLVARPALSHDRALARVWDVARAMADFTELEDEIDILNMSFVCATGDGKPPLVLTRAVDLLSPGVVLVAAAGNHGAVKPDLTKVGVAPYLTPKTVMWPAAFDNVTAVGARRDDGSRAEFSPDLPWVDLTALGVDVESTYLDGKVELFHERPTAPPVTFDGFATWSGTSFAAATVSGEIARRAAAGGSAQEALGALLNPDIHSRANV